MICAADQHVFAWGDGSAYPADPPPGTRCRCGRYAHGVEGVESTAVQRLKAERAAATARADAAEAEVAALRALLARNRTAISVMALRNGTGEDLLLDQILAPPPNSRGAALLAAGNRLADEMTYVLTAYSSAARFHDALAAWTEALGTEGGEEG